MRTLKLNPCPTTFDQIAIAFGELLLPVKNCKLCDRTSPCTLVNHIPKYVLFNPADYYPFILHEAARSKQFISPSHGGFNNGIIGNLWLATVALDYDVPFGKVVVSSESRESILNRGSDSPHSIMIDIWDIIRFRNE